MKILTILVPIIIIGAVVGVVVMNNQNNPVQKHQFCRVVIAQHLGYVKNHNEKEQNLKAVDYLKFRKERCDCIHKSLPAVDDC